MGEIEKYLLNLIIKEKKILISGMLAGFIFFLIYFFFFYTPLYTSTSNLYIKNIVKPNIITPFPDPGTVKSESGYSNPLFNLYELLKSENIAFNTYKRIKENYPKDLGELGVISKETFYIAYLNLVSSEVIPSTDVLVVSLKWPNRENSKEVLSIIIDEFRKENLQIRRSLDTKKRTYLDNQTEEIAEQLEKLRSQIKDYKIENRLTDAENEAANLVSIRSGIIKEISMLKAQIEYNSKKFDEYAKQLNINDPILALNAAGVGNDPYLVKLSQDLAIAQQNYAMLKTKFTDKYQEVIEVKSEIDKLKENIEQRKQETTRNVTLPRTIYDGPSTNIVSQFAQVHVERLSQREMLRTLEKGVNDILNKEKDVHIKQIGFDNLKKQEEAYAAAYQSIKAKQLEAKIQENEIVDNILTLKSPTRAALIQITLITKFIGFLLFGALAGLGIAYIKQGLEDKWANTDEVKRIIGQDVLGVIPWLKQENAENAKKIYEAAYTNIASEIITKACCNNATVLSFISTNINNSKSVVIDNISGLITSLEKKSIVLDFSQNFEHKPNIIDLITFISKNFKSAPNDSETYQNLKNEVYELIKKAVKVKEFVRNGNVSSIHYLGIENHNNNLNLRYNISSKSFSILLEYLKDEFDLVLINTPHGNFILPEINFIIKNSDAVVPIVSIDSNREELIKLVKNVSESGRKILGIITREKDTEIEKFFNKSSFNDSIEEKF